MSKILYPPDFYLFSTQTVVADWAATHPGAPLPWNPAKPIKRWFDTGAGNIAMPDGTVTYAIAGTMKFEPLTMALADALVPNVPPSVVNYPPYVIEPTTATSAGILINPEYLSTLADVQRLQSILGGVADSVRRGAVFPTTEPRREYTITIGGVPINVGQLLKQQNALGVGHPGAWSLVNSVPTWTPAPNDDAVLLSGTAEVPIPCKPLTATQTVEQGLMGWHVVDTAGDAPVLVASGGFTDADRATLQQILTAVKK